ncbi:gas vesicle protein GVPa [Natronococcus amylolyticus DSM 10524]|uniref:Gas vesicle protein GVPa n=1 Tax=Natronococcus amylolyticus DSM 10524 TaxID=1227497 RepID=L9X3X1_9EURY|nr:gas vesicle protein [Natronococcus amylolyticus]ELY55283.1 gas vesicle protein GVPa [Natronococcus amylolyticus DSM 10524]
MVDEFQPSRQKADLAEVVEMLLDKGIVINADIAVSIGDTQLLGVQLRAAIASFETAAKYGLEFPEGTDMQRLAEAVDDPELAEERQSTAPIDPTRGVNVTAESDGEEGDSNGEAESDGGDGVVAADHPGLSPDPDQPTSGGFDLLSDDADDESADESTDEETEETEED